MSNQENKQEQDSCFLQGSSSEAPKQDLIKDTNLNWYLRVILKEDQLIRAEFQLRGLTELIVDNWIKNLTTSEELWESSQDIFDMIHIMYSQFHWDDNKDFNVEYIKGVY